MRKSLHIPGSLRLALIGVSILFLTLAPRPRLLRDGLVGARQALEDAAPGRAAGRLAVVLAFEPWRTELWLAAGRYAVQDGDYQAAVKFLEQAGEYQELPPDDWMTLGDAYRSLGKDLEAASAWQNALERGADQLAISQRLFLVHQEQNDLLAVTQDLMTLADLELDNAQAQYQAGLYLAAFDPEAALPYLKRTAELDGELARQVRQLRDGIQAAALAEDPSFTLVNAGRQLAALDEWELANRAFQEAVQLNPDYGEAWAFLAEARQHLGSQELALAKEALDQALKSSPDSVLVHILASLYWQRLGDDNQAQDYLEKALLVEPENPVLYVEIGNILARHGDIQEARKAYQKAVDLDPKDISYRRALVEFLLHHQIELREAALPVARQSVLQAPDDPAALDLMGETLFLLGDYHTAGRFMERALQIDPEYAPALMHLGVISLFLGDGAKARQLLTQARDLAEDQSTIDQAQRLLEYYFP